MDHRADYSHASHYHPNDKPAEFDNVNHLRIRRPPHALPGNDPDLVTPEEILAGHRLFMRLLGSTRKPVMPRQGYPYAQADGTSIAPVTTPMPVPDVRSGQPSPPAPTLTPTPICEKPMGKEQSDFEALLRAGPNPAPKLEQVQLPTKVQEAAEALGITHGAFLIALGKLNGKLESVDSKQQSVQTGGSVDSNGDDNDNTMEGGDRGPESAAEKEKAPISDSSGVPAPPTPMAELLAGHAGYAAGLRYQNASSMSRRVGFLAESQKIAEALGVTPDALLGALEKVKDDGAKARIPMTAAEKEKAAIAADAGFWRTIAVAGLMCLRFMVMLLFFILAGDIGWLREVDVNEGSTMRWWLYLISFACFHFAELCCIRALLVYSGHGRLYREALSITLVDGRPTVDAQAAIPDKMR
jgi:hypothetical protein